MRHPISSFLGFDPILEAFAAHRPQKQQTYPPYNVTSTPSGFLIEVAVAGFAQDEIIVEADESRDQVLLSIQGRRAQSDAPEGHQRIISTFARRDFDLRFALAHGYEVTEAKVADGVLTLPIVRKDTPNKVRRIAVTR